MGVFLLALGLFFTAAFVSGRGAFLGDVGTFVGAQLIGVIGFALAPLAAACGLLLLLGRLGGRFVAGAVLLLLAAAATFAATLPQRQLFSARHYTEAGGLLGSGFYAVVQWGAGAVGAALAIGMLYALGLSLLTGVSFASALTALKTLGEKVVGLGRGLWEGRETRQAPSPKRGAARKRAANSRADTNVQDGLVNVAVGRITISDINVGVAAQIAAAICGVDVGPIGVLALAVDAGGPTRTVCKVFNQPVQLTQD